MRATLLGWLPDDLHGRRILDAGCGTGALAVEAARRGAEVVAIDLSATLVNLARERLPAGLPIDFRVGDMLDPALGRFDHVVGMDSLIHYRAPDMARAVAGLAARADRSVLFTFAPRTPLLSAMHAAGQAVPARRPRPRDRAGRRAPSAGCCRRAGDAGLAPGRTRAGRQRLLHLVRAGDGAAMRHDRLPSRPWVGHAA